VKTCAFCGTTKSSKWLAGPQCRKCYRAQYRAKNRERELLSGREYEAANREVRNEKSRIRMNATHSKRVYLTKQCADCGYTKTLRNWGGGVCSTCRTRTYRASPHGKYRQLIAGGKQRDLEVTLTPEQHKALSEKPCHYCERALPRSGANLDRLDNSLGYTPENVVPCCHECNYMRGDILSPEETFYLARQLQQFRRLKNV
jgi:hypothetical protein